MQLNCDINELSPIEKDFSELPVAELEHMLPPLLNTLIDILGSFIHFCPYFWLKGMHLDLNFKVATNFIMIVVIDDFQKPEVRLNGFIT